jgi:hypothetical protein
MGEGVLVLGIGGVLGVGGKEDRRQGLGKGKQFYKVEPLFGQLIL